MESLNIDNELKKGIINLNENGLLNQEENNKRPNIKIISKLPINEILEKIDKKEINIENAPPSSPMRRKNNPRRNLANSTKFGLNYGIEKPPPISLFNEESKSDDEDNINEQKIGNIEEEETEGRKSIFTKYSTNLEQELDVPENMDEIFDNSKYIKKLEEKWKYEKILLDYNIIDFTSK